MYFCHCSLTATQPKVPLTTPSSLQSLQPVRKQQVMLPDRRGILWPHHLRVDTVRHIQNIADAEERMEAATMQHQQLVRSSSLGSVPSTSSLHSTTSATSQFSQVSGAGNMWVISENCPDYLFFSCVMFSMVFVAYKVWIKWLEKVILWNVTDWTLFSCFLRDITNQLRQLHQMITMATSQQDVDNIKVEIERLLSKQQQQQCYLSSFPGKGNKK